MSAQDTEAEVPAVEPELLVDENESKQAEVVEEPEEKKTRHRPRRPADAPKRVRANPNQVPDEITNNPKLLEVSVYPFFSFLFGFLASPLLLFDLFRPVVLFQQITSAGFLICLSLLVVFSTIT